MARKRKLGDPLFHPRDITEAWEVYFSVEGVPMLEKVFWAGAMIANETRRLHDISTGLQSDEKAASRVVNAIGACRRAGLSWTSISKILQAEGGSK